MKHSAVKLKRILTRLFCLRHIDLRCGYLGGLIMLIFTVLIRLLSGSPYRVYCVLRGSDFLPSLATLTFVNLLLTIAMGFACGLVLSCPRRSRQGIKYRGGMLFVLLTVFWLAAYPLVFQGCLLALALLSLILTWILCLGCVSLFFRVNPLSGWISVIFLFWLTYLILGLLGCILWM